MTKRIAVLTSGGDAPGMNAAIRAVTRCAIEYGWEVMGVHYGYAGLVDGKYELLTARSVGGIMQQAGTMLGSARSLEFKTAEGRAKALHQLQTQHVEALVVIGGNGSQTGAYSLDQEGFPVVGVASTIDNDLIGADVTIGVDTALNIALESIDRLKSTASSHQRAFLVEVMGRDCGYLALMTGLAGGAEAIVIPEIETTPEQVAEAIRRAHGFGKTHAIVVVAEGATYNAAALQAYYLAQDEDLGFELRSTTLGYVQRGGVPTASDRLLGTRLGAGAVAALSQKQHGVLVGLIGGQMTMTPLAEVVNKQKPLDAALFALADSLNH